MAVIKAIKAREILDSRGNPTIETSIWTDNTTGATASIPSGASIGQGEALELRDNDPNRFQGKGMLKAVALVNNVISKYIIGQDPTKQNKIDQILINLDGTKNKSKLGANTILSISQAVCELGARVSSMQTYEYLQAKYGLHQSTPFNLPTPMFNIINGGKHGSGNLDFQEFHLIPTSRVTFKQALLIGDDIYQQLKKLLISKKTSHSVGDEGGFTPQLSSNTDAIELIIETIEASSYRLGNQVFLGLDLAASQFFKSNQYHLRDQKEAYSQEDYLQYLINLIKNYKLILLEDPLDQNDWKNWINLTAQIGKGTLIVGDDLLTTHKDKLTKAIKKKACNAIIIKPNQVGTISETVSVVKLAKKNNFTVVVSHRSGDTTENFMADFAVGVGAEYVKFGAPSRGERTSKYNRLSQIQEYLQAKIPPPAIKTPVHP